MTADIPSQYNQAASETERLNDLEIKFAYPQETLDSLNDTVTKQWDVIEKLRRHITRLEGQLVEMGDWQGGGNEPPPPHY